MFSVAIQKDLNLFDVINKTNFLVKSNKYSMPINDVKILDKVMILDGIKYD